VCSRPREGQTPADQLPKLIGRALIDAETGKEIWVGRFEDAIAADADESRTELDATADPDLDIPF
jgi:hypothetical protein